eukprot:TRINITY_DN20587_c0_g1_i1.p1 TRINITY_DN20587_c0_g1~~TRINITY_DN20587_c0_g1_i1.p1  ORF type:complete len:117 (-),score=33.05 TRINITY_DN20587_c0_g1_i1:3-323(-)
MCIRDRAVIVVISGTLGYLIITNSSVYIGKLDSTVPPTVCFVVVSFLITTLFMKIYSSANDAIFNCLTIEMDTFKIPRKRRELLDVIKALRSVSYTHLTLPTIYSV